MAGDILHLLFEEPSELRVYGSGYSFNHHLPGFHRGLQV
jgi:hypothetical protein